MGLGDLHRQLTTAAEQPSQAPPQQVGAAGQPTAAQLAAELEPALCRHLMKDWGVLWAAKAPAAPRGGGMGAGGKKRKGAGKGAGKGDEAEAAAAAGDAAASAEPEAASEGGEPIAMEQEEAEAWSQPWTMADEGGGSCGAGADSEDDAWLAETYDDW